MFRLRIALVLIRHTLPCAPEILVLARKERSDQTILLNAHLEWIGERVGRPNYRGCPQINVAAEFPEAGHPARKVAADHKREMRRRLKDIAERLGADRPDELAGQLSMLINGAFVSSQIIETDEAIRLLQRAVHPLIAARRKIDNRSTSA